MAQQLNWEKKDNLEDIKIILAKILRRWYWIGLALVFAILSAYLYVRYEDEVFVVNASFISRKFDAGVANVVPTISEAGQFTDRIEVNQQIPLLKSENRIYETLNRLDFGVTYIVEGRLKATELYKNNPFKVITNDSSSFIPYNTQIIFEKQSNSSYILQSDDERLNRKLENETFLFNVNQNIDGWQFNIKHANGNGINPDYKYYFIINHPRSLMNTYRSMLNIDWAFRESAILSASVNTKIPEKDYDFLKTYLDVVIDFGLQEKKEYLINSINFMDTFMLDITDTLLQYQNEIDDFRMSNRDVITGSSLVIDKLKSLEEEKAALMLESNYYSYLEEYIRKQRMEEVFAPNLIGLDVPPLQELIKMYMEQKWEDKVDKNASNEKNPLILKGNEEFERMEENIYESVKNLKELNQTQIKDVDTKINFYLRTIDDLSVEYRKYFNLDRLRAIYEELYNRLLTRKTDASISMASVTSDYQIVTEPSYSNKPISPNVTRSYILAIIVGLGFPIGLILLVDFINPKVISKRDLKNHTNIPIIGSVGHFKGKTNLVVSKKPKSQVAESFRVIRANLEYLSSVSDEAKIILITSSISGEGKTFCSTNLAYTYANMGRKTLLIGADMRRPALARNFKMEQSHGLSNYLSGQDQVEDIIHTSENENLDVIPGGHVPPNPAELLTSLRMDDLMIYIRKEYELIIFDTPPIGLVSDTVELIKHSYIPILIVRQDVTYKKSLDAITEMYESGKYKNLGIIMNDINYTRFDYGTYYGRSYGYGSGHGYGYHDEDRKKSLWKRLFRS